jgi:hypothetical protein
VPEFVAPQLVLIQAFDIPLDPSDIVDDILEGVGIAVVLRRHGCGPVRR